MYSTEKIIKVMESKGYPLFRNDSKNFNLNLIGIRSKDDNANTFNDKLVVLWKNQGWNQLNFSITTDPGIYWRENPMNVNGTAILCEGHHKSLWSLGLHKNTYKALVQTGVAKVYRDNNKDDKLDMTNTQEGLFGINCHRANSNGPSQRVDKWSAGCQVFQDPYDFKFFMEVCEKSRTNFGNKFSYTLLLEEWFDELD